MSTTNLVSMARIRSNIQQVQSKVDNQFSEHGAYQEQHSAGTVKGRQLTAMLTKLVVYL
jgi:hypothetical protein